ncbi:hypothetical protein [Lentzea sp. NPDC060358]|uniref:hypothetical protein n=1 Tax=Lentzea sp. NPDC060358 TaxID=3347103 RepID=UPI003654F362
MEVGDVAAWFSAGVAIIAAVIAMSNANSAKTQAGAALKQAAEAEKARKAAETQADEAKKAREAAEAGVEQAQRSAEAAEQQVALMRNQLAAAEADRHEQNAPQFVVTWNPTGDSYGEDGAWFSIAYTSGPPQLDKVTVAVIPGSEAEGLALHESERPEHLSIELAPMYAGVACKFIARLNVQIDSDVVFLVGAASETGSWEGRPVMAIHDDY